MTKVAIVGFGSEGLSAYKFWSARGAKITVFDESDSPKQQVPHDVEFKTGPGCFDNLNGYDVVMRFPGINPKRIHTDGEISSVTKEFFKYCPAPIIGVTGSKGKGTTCSLIHLILKNSGINTHLVGNIGKPALDELSNIKPKDVVVFELSSFQLWDLNQSPKVAVVLMIEPDHLDVHDNMQDYINAKSNIVKWQKASDLAVYHPTNNYVGQIMGSALSRKLAYARPPACRVENNNFVIDDQIICSISQMKLVGKHNQDNACAAITAAWEFTQNADAIIKALNEFTGLDHRLKFIRELENVKYYDDSIATTPGSAIAALKSFEEPKTIILGGSDKGADFSELCIELAKHQIRKVLLIGQTGPKIADGLNRIGFKNYEQLGSPLMSQIVGRAKELSQKGDVIVISPACASFDMFKSYKDRGDQFIQSVNNL